MENQRYNIGNVGNKESVLDVCNKAVSNGRYRSQNQRKIYEVCGIKKFKNCLMRINDQEKYHLKRSSLDDLKGYQEQSKKFEKSHVIGGLAGLALSIPILFSDENAGVKLGALGLCNAINFSINGLPIMLQKYNQSRLKKAINRREKR